MVLPIRLMKTILEETNRLATLAAKAEPKLLETTCGLCSLQNFINGRIDFVALAASKL